MKKITTLLALAFCLNGKAQCVNSPTLNVVGATVVNPACGQQNGSISGLSITGGTSPLNYQWYNTGTGQVVGTTISLSNVPGGTYSLQVIDAMGCNAVIVGGVSTFVISFTSVVAGFMSNPSTGSIPLTVTFTNQSVGATTYEWIFGDGHTSTAVNPSNTYTAIGTYTVILIAKNGSCADTAHSIILAHVAGIEQFANSNEQINIYPNPNNGSFVIEPSPSLTLPQWKGTLMQVYDVTGKLVLSQTIQPSPNPSKEGTSIAIDASSLNEGIYNISLQSNEGVVNKRVVIVK